MNTKECLLLLFLSSAISTICHNDPSTYSVESVNLLSNQLTKINLQMDSIQNEIKFHGSRSPAINDSTIGIIIGSASIIIYILGSVDSNIAAYCFTEACKLGALMGAGLYFASTLGPDIRAHAWPNDNLKRSFEQYEMLAKQRTEILRYLMATKK